MKPKKRIEQPLEKKRDFFESRDYFSKINDIYYTLKPVIPRNLQLALRRGMIRFKREKNARVWPIDPSAGDAPMHFKGWPDGKSFAFLLLHDVDTQIGHDQVRALMDLETSLGFVSSFHFVPERYTLSPSLLEEVTDRGFGLGVHGLKHDGKLFTSLDLFKERAVRINRYLELWGTKGFSSPSMLRKLEWMGDLDIAYGTTTFDTDPFEPQPDGIQTIFPFWVKDLMRQKRYLEMPYTMPQDFTLYVLMRNRNIDIWQKKMMWLAEKKGMVLINTHPDYMNFAGSPMRPEAYDVKIYERFLRWVKETFKDSYWHGRASTLATYFENQDAALSELIV